jgi:hypothetical protein
MKLQIIAAASMPTLVPLESQGEELFAIEYPERDVHKMTISPPSLVSLSHFIQTKKPCMRESIAQRSPEKD